MGPCNYTATYYDFSEKKEKSFICDETTKEALCIFHDVEKFQENVADIKKRLVEKMSRSISSNSPLLLVGYNFPDFSLEASETKDFSNYICLRNATFHGVAHFSGASFAGCDFYNVTFKHSVDFSDAKFNGQANFQLCTFDDMVYFKRSTFAETALFNGAIFGEETYAARK